MSQKLPDADPRILQLGPKEPTLLFAIQDLVTTQGINFDEWWNEWKRGAFLKNQTNTKIIQQKWKTPKLEEITPLNSESGCKTYRYWRDASKLQDSIIISGTPPMLVQQIVEYDHKSQSYQQSTRIKGGVELRLRGFPLVSLYFLQAPDKVGTRADGTLLDPVRGEPTFRLVGKSDDPDSGIDMISKADLKVLTEKINKIFNTPKPFVWEKGKECVSYRKRIDGFEAYYFCKNKAAGLKILKAMLGAADKKYESKYMFHSKNESPSDAFPEVPKEITLLGEKTTLDRIRPVADVYFRDASIYLPRSGKTIELITYNHVAYK